MSAEYRARAARHLISKAEYRLAVKAAIAYANRECEKLPRPNRARRLKNYSAAWSAAFSAFKAGYHAALKERTQ